MGVFDLYLPEVYKHNYTATLNVGRLVGGTPTDPNVAAGWIKSRVTEMPKDDILREEIAAVMIARGVEGEAINQREALEEVNKRRHLNGFKKDDKLGLYIEGRQPKAMLKENFNIAYPKAKWGPSNKGTMSFIAEHVFVLEDRIYLGVTEPTDVQQRFVHTWRGTGIQYEEVVDNIEVTFTVASDFLFSEEQWANIWLRAQFNGLGASRSQGYGKFEVVGWEPVVKKVSRRKAA